VVASLTDLRTRTDNWLGRFRALEDQLNTEKELTERIREEHTATKGAISLLQFIAAETAKANEEQTAKLATMALRETFEDQKLSLLVEHSVSRGHPGVTFKLRDEESRAEGDPLESFGGGPSSLLGVVLQTISTVRQPKMARVLILDEPLAQISREYAEKAGRFLRKLCEPPLEFKMLVVTHSDAIARAAHKRYTASKVGGRFVLTEGEPENG